MSAIAFYPRRDRLLSVILLSFALAIACAWQLSAETATIIAAGITAGFCLTAGVFALSRLRTSLPMLTIGEAGITDNTSPLSVGLMPWPDILGVEAFRFMGAKYLGIQIRNPEDYFAKTTTMKRLSLKINARLSGYSVSIPLLALPQDAGDELLRWCVSCGWKHKLVGQAIGHRQ